MYSQKTLLHKRQREFKAGNLRTIALDVTPICNMHCKRCYAETFARATPIDLPILKRTLDELYELGVYHYVLQGGEPLEDRERLGFILDNCHPDESYINVVSNGWLINFESILWLKDRKVDKISFSLDSGLESEHDKLRREGSFFRVINGIVSVQNEGLLTSISCVVTHTSLYSPGFNRLLEIAKFFKIRLDVQIAEPVGLWDGRIDVLITPDDAAYIKQLQTTMGKLPNGQNLINRDIFSGDFDHCPAGTEFMGISVNGEVLPCNFLQFTLGNIKDHSFKELRDKLLQRTKWFNGKIPCCLCGEHQDFIQEFILPYTATKKPLSIEVISNDTTV